MFYDLTLRCLRAPCFPEMRSNCELCFIGLRGERALLAGRWDWHCLYGGTAAGEASYTWTARGLNPLQGRAENVVVNRGATARGEPDGERNPARNTQKFDRPTLCPRPGSRRPVSKGGARVGGSGPASSCVLGPTFFSGPGRAKVCTSRIKAGITERQRLVGQL